MAASVVIEGLDSVMAALNEQIGQIEGRTTGGLLAGGLIIQREAQKRTPVLTGNLKGSAYTRKTPEDDKVVEVGFSAAYALFVHENLEAHHTNGQAKFLESAADDTKDQVLEAIRSRVAGQEPAGQEDTSGEDSE